MKSEKNRSERAEAATQTKHTTKEAADGTIKKKKKKKPISEKAEAELTTANVNKAAKEAVTERITKYIYPDEIKTAKDKKDYRRKCRAKIAEFTKAINKLKKSKEDGAEKELSKKEKEFNSWKAEHLTAAE